MSLTRGKNSAANPLASVLIYKNRTGAAPVDPANPSPENIDMTAEEIAKALADARTGAETSAVTKILGMTDVTKAHYVALKDDAAKTAFLAKSAEDMNAEAAAAVAAAETAKATAAASQTDLGKMIAEAVKGAIAPMSDEITKLRAQVETFQSTDVFKARAAKDFAGHPRGEQYVVDTLKSVASATDEVKKTVEETLKQGISFAKFAGMSAAAVVTGGEAVGAGATTAVNAIKAKAAEVAKAKDISFDAALIEVSEDPENAGLYEAGLHQN